MSEIELPRLEDITTQQSLNLQQAQFQGMTIQALKDMKEDIKDIKRTREIRDYINYGISVLLGAIAGIFGSSLHH